jgi:hypothetical protein
MNSESEGEASAALAVEVRDIGRPDRQGSQLRGFGVRKQVLAVTGCAELEGLIVANGDGSGLNALFALLHAHHVIPRILSTSAEGVRVWAPRGAGLEAVGLELSERARALAPAASAVVVGGGAEGGQRALEVLEAAGLTPTFAALGEDRASQVFLFERTVGARAMQALHQGLLATAEV